MFGSVCSWGGIFGGDLELGQKHGKEKTSTACRRRQRILPREGGQARETGVKRGEGTSPGKNVVALEEEQRCLKKSRGSYHGRAL